MFMTLYAPQWVSMDASVALNCSHKTPLIDAAQERRRPRTPRRSTLRFTICYWHAKCSVFVIFKILNTPNSVIVIKRLHVISRVTRFCFKLEFSSSSSSPYTDTPLSVCLMRSVFDLGITLDMDPKGFSRYIQPVHSFLKLCSEECPPPSLALGPRGGGTCMFARCRYRCLPFCVACRNLSRWRPVAVYLRPTRLWSRVLRGALDCSMMIYRLYQGYCGYCDKVQQCRTASFVCKNSRPPPTPSHPSHRPCDFRQS